MITNGTYGLEIANPIYREVIPRELTYVSEGNLGQDPKQYIKENGKLDIEKLISEYIKFYKENSELVTSRKLYNEAAHHLLFMAWAHKIANSGGKVTREYGAGLKRLDMLIEFRDEKFAFELKLMGNTALEDGKKQLKMYLDRLSLESGWLIIYSRKEPQNWDEVGRRERIVHEGKSIEVIYM